MKFALVLSVAVIASSTNVKAETLNFGSAIQQWALACQADVEKHCSDIRPGTGNFSTCLIQNASQTCKQATNAFQANMDARFAAQAAAPEACKPDVARLCSNFNTGQARILRCLMKPERFKSVRSVCKQTLEAAGWLDEISIRQQ